MLFLRATGVLTAAALVFAMGLKAFARNPRGDWRLNVLSTCTILCAWFTLGAELLSAFSVVTVTGVGMFVGISLLALVALGIVRHRRQPYSAMPGLSRHIKAVAGTSNLWTPLLFSGLVIGALLLIALTAAPNNWDSLTYHLSRIMHWQQDRSLRFYPTDNIRQLHSGPGAEIALLYLVLLAGSDRLVNLVQWSAMVGAVIGVSILVKLLGGCRRAQVMAVVLAVTIPMGILQANSTQNDYVVAFWLMCFVVFSMLCLGRQGNWIDWLLAGASLGLAILTKATALVFAAPIALWTGLSLLRRLGWSTWKPGLLIAATALLMNAGAFTRNAAMFGNPLGPTTEYPETANSNYTNDIYSAPALLSNLLRNIALHLGTPIPNADQSLVSAVQVIHGWIGMDASDPRTTWLDSRCSVAFSLDENNAGNGLHLVLMFIGMLLMVRFGNLPLKMLCLCLTLGFILFCLLFKWQPWNSRLHLPLFVLGAAFTAAVLDQAISNLSQNMVMMALAVAVTPFLLFNDSRPLIGPYSILITDRNFQYFAKRLPLESAYLQAAEVVRLSHCTAIGIIANIDDAEYPFWVLIRADQADVTLQAVDVHNISARLAQPFNPCALLDTRPGAPAELSILGLNYQRVFAAAPVAVYLRPGQLLSRR